MHRLAAPKPFVVEGTLADFAWVHEARDSPSGASAPTWSRSRRVKPSQNFLFEPRMRIIWSLLSARALATRITEELHLVGVWSSGLRLVDHHHRRTLLDVLGLRSVHPHVVVGIAMQEEPVVGVLAVLPELDCLGEVPHADSAAASWTMRQEDR